MPAPLGISCDICGQKFFKRSLPIHRKQCEKKYQQCFTECKKCLRKVSNDEYEKHASECKVVRKKTARNQAKEVKAKEREIRQAQKRQDDDDDSETDSSSDEEDCREECEFCKRKFNPDRIAKHEQICATNAERRKRKQFKTPAEQRLEGTDFEKYLDPKTRRKVEKPMSGKWRQDHERLQGMVEQGRLVKAFQDAGVPLSQLPRQGENLKALVEDGSGSSRTRKPEDEPVEAGMTRCPHCKRTFRDETATRHIPKCKTTKNKPKKLERKSKPVLDKPREDYTTVIKTIVKKVLKMKTKKNSFFETKEASMYQVGEPVLTGDGRKGTIRFIGRCSELFPGYWVGLELDEKKGNNDGTVQGGSAYFKCEDGHGLYIRPSKLKKFVELLPVKPKETKVEIKKTDGDPVKATTEETTSSTQKESGKKSSEAAKSTEKQTSKKEKREKKTVKEDDENNASTKKNKKADSKKESGMVERLRKEVRANSPRTDCDERAELQKQKQVTAARKENPKKAKAEAARQARLNKDVQFLEALHGKPCKGERAPDHSGGGNKLGSKMAGEGRTLGKANAPAARPDRAARAAFFEKKFAQKT